MSLKAGSGRKKVSVIWNYFEHRPLTDKSECKTCKFQLKGCNPTNLTSARKRNRTSKSLEKRVFLKLNARLFSVAAAASTTTTATAMITQQQQAQMNT